MKHGLLYCLPDGQLNVMFQQNKRHQMASHFQPQLQVNHNTRLIKFIHVDINCVRGNSLRGKKKAWLMFAGLTNNNLH